MPQRPPLTPTQRTLRARLAAHESWARTTDRSARTAAARQAFADRFERQVDPDGDLDPETRAKAAQNARSAYFTGLAFKRSKTVTDRVEVAADGNAL